MSTDQNPQDKELSADELQEVAGGTAELNLQKKPGITDGAKVQAGDGSVNKFFTWKTS